MMLAAQRLQILAAMVGPVTVDVVALGARCDAAVTRRRVPMLTPTARLGEDPSAELRPALRLPVRTVSGRR
jgi:hypothetical protein